MISKMTKKQALVTLKDALYNTHERSGASAEYAKGIVVGSTSGLMATGLSFSDAIILIAEHLPNGYRAYTIPDNWLINIRAHIPPKNAKK